MDRDTEVDVYVDEEVGCCVGASGRGRVIGESTVTLVVHSVACCVGHVCGEIIVVVSLIITLAVVSSVAAGAAAEAGCNVDARGSVGGARNNGKKTSTTALIASL